MSGEWSARVSAQVQHRDDWVKNTIASAPTQNFKGFGDRANRLLAMYSPSTDFSALFNLHHRDLKGSARLFRANAIKKGGNDLVDGFDAAKISTDGQTGQSLQYTGGCGAAFLPSGGGPGLIPFPSETAGGIHDHQQLTQAFRLESNTAGPLAWQAGLHFIREKYAIDRFGCATLGGGAQVDLATSQQTHNAWAAFGSVNDAISKALSVRGGLRYTQDKRDFSTTAVQGKVKTNNGLSANTADAKLYWDLSASYALSSALNATAAWPPVAAAPASRRPRPSAARPWPDRRPTAPARRASRVICSTSVHASLGVSSAATSRTCSPAR